MFIQCCQGRIKQSPLQYAAFFCFEAVTRGLDDISNNRLKSEDVRGIKDFDSKNNLSEIHISRPMP